MTLCFRNDRSTSWKSKRFGFTLVELLVVLTVMVSLGGILTLALASATTEARIKRTQADVLTIGQLMQSRVNEISLSRVNLVYSTGLGPTGTAAGYPLSSLTVQSLAAQERARLILSARRDLARMVLPECRADLLLPPATLQYRVPVAGGWRAGVAQVRPPTQWDRMRTLAGLYPAAAVDAFFGTSNPMTDPTIDAIAVAHDGADYQAPFDRFLEPDSAGNVDLLDDNGAVDDDRVWSRENESAECLYLILATTELFETQAIDQIPSSNIGDTDGDGFLEILDAWGQPYEFIRNPAAYDTPAIKNFVRGGATTEEQYPADPDPFDFLLADWRYEQGNFSPAPTSLLPYLPYYLPPAVISAGQDGEFGIQRTFGNTGSGVDVKDFYSSSNVVVTANTPTPAWPNIVYRHPNPYMDVTAFPISGTFTVHAYDIEGILRARTFGLGATLDREQASDNISSLDTDF
ncbi:MAG: prepilin-type N-terminal cleavage/methylation domain-containing protein [Planctomycetota bacterium]